MYLKQIEMQGFKSFPDRTKLVFEKGATVVVGPNGSGKSNISDAMRWVLGEISAKSLRGSKMEDVIFGGSDSRKPMTYAEVSVTFDNSGEDRRLDLPYDEITVTRRYHRNGDSEYFINRGEARLRDIYEMFLNTGIGRDGYSIIEQGRIAEIISKKSDDRREIFEDAAGIAKYRHKKNEAERKLAATNLNIERVRDGMNIMSGHLASLQRESIRAKRFIEYSEIKKQADVRLWLFDTEKLRSEISESESAGGKTDRELDEINEEIRTLYSRQERLEELAGESRRSAAELIERIREKTGENYELDSEIKVTRTKLEHLEKAALESAEKAKSYRAAAEEEKKTAAARRADAARMGEEIKEQSGKETAFTEKAEALAKRADDLDSGIAEAFSRISDARAEISDIDARLELLGRSDSEEETRDEAVRRELDEREKTAARHEAECRDSEALIRDYEIRVLSLSSELEKLRSRAAGLETERDRLNGEIQSASVKERTLSGNIETLRRMEEHFEGYNNSVRHVMQSLRDGRLSPRGRIWGPVSSLISVESKYVTAVEIALGAAIQNIVVDDEETAREAIGCLRRDNAGRATFFPLTSVKASVPTREMKDAASFRGYVGVASDLVSCDARFAPVISSMLGRTVVFDTLENATEMAKACRYSVRTVTLDGQQINRDGSFTGGSVRTGSGILTRADEIKRMESELAATKKLSDKLSGKLGATGKDLDGVLGEIGSRENEKGLIEKLCAVEKAKLEKQRESLNADRELLSKFRADIENSEGEKEERQAEAESLRARRRELAARVSELEEWRNDADVSRGDALNERDENVRLATAATVRISELRRDIESAGALAAISEEKAAQLLSDAGKCDSDAETARKNLASLNGYLAGCLRDLAAGSSEIEKFAADRAEAEKAGLDYEQKLASVRRTLSERQSRRDVLMQEKLASETSLASRRSQLDAMSQKFWEEHALTRAEALACGYPPLTAEERPAVLELQTEYRNKIRNVGNCDPASIEEYEKEKAKYDELTAQLADLDKAREDFEEVISDLEAQMEKSFSTAFDAINDNFRQTFTELFGGGSAELVLTDPDHILESGIEIKVAPPGKIIKSLMQLSGGEQSFVAIALLFAILRVNPTPFCIFDEIEAALDEVNVERFAQYVRRYSEHTQLIIITHRRGTMNSADRLYGVTMPESGISKVLSIDVAEIAEKKGELWNGLS